MPTMLAVCNTSPISNLVSIGRLELLKTQFPLVWIPSAVGEELGAHPDEQERAAIQTAIDSQWIRLATPSPSKLLGVLLKHLHRGEAEAIALAIELQANIVVIDEHEARQFATDAGLSVTGVLGILLRAKKRGDISAVRPEIRLLREKARFFVSPALEANVLALAGE
jgi:uncharacterized protein